MPLGFASCHGSLNTLTALPSTLSNYMFHCGLCDTDFNLGENGSLLLEASLEDLFLRLNETIELFFEFQLNPNATLNGELMFMFSVGFANSGMS